MPYRLLIKPIIESFIDNVLRDTVEPSIGSILYCDLALNTVEHSGIYIGDNKIVHLDGSGIVEKVSPEKFLNRLDGLNTAISIYVACRDKIPIGSKEIANRAKSMIGKKRNYNLLSDNCHQFTSGCITGNFENNDNFFLLLKQQMKESLNYNEFRVWKRESYNLNKSIKSIKYIKESKKEKEIDVIDNTNIELLKITSIILHYILNKTTILPIDILYFENILQDEFNCNNKNILKDMYELKKTINKEDINILITNCFQYLSDKEIYKIKKVLEKVVYEDCKGDLYKLKDIRMIMHKLKK